MNALSKGYVRDKDDFYPTPKECTRALIDAEGRLLPNRIWEPACGNGAISSVLAEAGKAIISTDLVDRGFGSSGVDFLLEQGCPYGIKTIITNPPFKLATEFIRHAETLGVEYMAMLLPSQFWWASGRTDLFNRWRPARIHALGWRPDMFGIGSPDQRCLYAWTIWDGVSAETKFSILRRPT